jgi:K+-sensing histidine kinase KdpD
VAGQGADDTAEALSDVLLSCQELRHIIDNVQLLSHVLAGEPVLAREPTALRDLVSGVALECGAIAKSRSVTVAILSDVSPLVQSHSAMLERAVANLLRNAVTYAPSGSSVRMTVSEQAAHAALTIEDSGPALDPTFGATAFGAEGQLKAKSTRGGRYGRGLGLFCAAVAARAAGAALSFRRTDAPLNIFELALDAL